MSRETRKGKEFTATTKAQAFKRADGKCEGCGQKLQPGRFHYDHCKAIALGGDNSLANCAVLCTPCHREKTTREDTPHIVKADAQRKAHNGITPPKRPIPSPPKQLREARRLAAALPELKRRSLFR